MTAMSGFSIWFLNLRQGKRVVLSCPQSTVNVNGEEELSTLKKQWLDLAKDQQVNSNVKLIEYSLVFACGVFLTS